MFKVETQENISDSLKFSMVNGFVGTVLVGSATIAGEALDRVGVVESFSGSTGAKIAGILAVYGATSWLGQKLFEPIS